MAYRLNIVKMNNISNLIKRIKPILDSIDQPITAVDQEGYFVYYNQASARMDGSDPDKVIGQHLLDVNKWLTAEQSTLLQCLKDKKQITNSYQVFQGIGGFQVHYLHSVTPLFAEDSTLIGAIEIGRTIQEMPTGTQSKKKKDIPAIITHDPRLKEEIRKLDIFAHSDLPIIVCGETGTGKELFAQRAHALSTRHARPLISLNCAAIPDTLLESTLFGTVRGAYTGAENRKGLLSLANGGTLFLDEINSMATSLQSKLLRVLQDGNYLPVGAQIAEHTDIRIIAALNQSPLDAIQKGKLRQDLYYRLNIGEIFISPLRARPKDIVGLAQFFVAQFAPKLRPEVTMIDEGAIQKLMQHTWPGNVRELQNTISRSLLLHSGGPRLKNLVLTQQHLTDTPNTISPSEPDKSPLKMKRPLTLSEQTKIQEKNIIKMALKEYDNNISATAKSLGIPRTTLNSKMKKLGLHTKDS